MLKVCETCRYRAADNDETTCPTCSGELRFSFLSFDAVEPPSPRPEMPPRQTWSAPGWSVLWERLIGSPISLVALFLLISAVAYGVGDRAMKAADSGNASELSNQIRVGMHISEVGQLLDNSPRRSPSYPSMRDYFPADEFGDGTIDYDGDGIKLKIDFVGGRVTSVEESPSSAGPGFHRCQMIVRQR